MTFPVNVTPLGSLILTSPVVVSNGTVNGGGGGSLDPATQAYINAIGTAGGTVSSGRQTLFDNFITSVKSAGVFSKANRMYFLANEASINARVDVITGAVATLSGTVTFTTDHGAAGDGSTGYLDTGFNPTVDTSNWSLNSATLGVYTRNSRGAGADMCNVGAQSDGNHSDFYPMWSDGNMYARANGSGSIAGGLAGSNSQGMFVMSLGASGARFVRKNGAAYATQTDNPTGVPNFTFLIGATHTAGAPASFSTDENAFVFIGSALTTTEADALASAVNTYMTAIGANVY